MKVCPPIFFTTIDMNAPMGWMAIAATEHGVCIVEIGDNDESVTADLFHRFNRFPAQLQRDDERLDPFVSQVQSYINGAVMHFAVPLERAFYGTPFQWQVWDALQAIPYGEKRTYRDIAVAIGRPASARAVANGCTTNPMPIIIPCHRVVRSNGSLGGYGAGEWRKRWLLDMETTSLARMNKQ